MSDDREVLLLALDEGLRGIEAEQAELHAVRSIDRRLGDLGDVELLRGLYHHARPWQVLVTLEGGLLHLPREMCALEQLGLALVVLQAGYDPIRAQELLRVHLPAIVKDRQPGAGQLWELGAGYRPPRAARDQLEQIGQQRGVEVTVLWEAYRLADAELSGPPW